jgi:hypothetical protein
MVIFIVSNVTGPIYATTVYAYARSFEKHMNEGLKQIEYWTSQIELEGEDAELDWLKAKGD